MAIETCQRVKPPPEAIKPVFCPRVGSGPARSTRKNPEERKQTDEDQNGSFPHSGLVMVELHGWDWIPRCRVKSTPMGSWE